MRARNIKPGFYKNEDLAECSPWARLIFPGLWMLADRDGRLEDRPKRIKAELLAFDSQEIEPLLGELEAHGFLVRYRNEDGAFIQISKFSTHQTPHYSEKGSVIKPPLLQESTAHKETKAPRELQENSEGKTVLKRGSQPPDSLNPDSLNPESRASTTVDPPTPARDPVEPTEKPTPAGAICRAMKAAGLAQTNPGHPLLLMLIEAGATEAEFVGAAKAACEQGKAFPWALARLKGQREEASRLAATHPKGAQRPAGQTGPEDWERDWPSVQAKGRELGLDPHPNETLTLFRNRVRTALQKRGAT